MNVVMNQIVYPSNNKTNRKTGEVRTSNVGNNNNNQPMLS